MPMMFVYLCIEKQRMEICTKFYTSSSKSRFPFYIRISNSCYQVLKPISFMCLSVHLLIFNPYMSFIYPLPIHSSISSLQRWGRLRASMMPLPVLFEPFTECLLLGVVGSLSVHYIMGWNRLLFLFCHCVIWFICDLILLHLVEVCCVVQ